jgi:hypothetical protein
LATAGHGSDTKDALSNKSFSKQKKIFYREGAKYARKF